MRPIHPVRISCINVPELLTNHIKSAIISIESYSCTPAQHILQNTPRPVVQSAEFVKIFIFGVTKCDFLIDIYVEDCFTFFKTLKSDTLLMDIIGERISQTKQRRPCQ